MKVAFHNPNVSIRGTFAAMVDYAEMNQTILGNESILFMSRSRAAPYLADLPALTRGLPVVLYDKPAELAHGIRGFGADFFYQICPGFFQVLPKVSCPIGIHAVFPHSEFFGEKYLYFSAWLARVMTRCPERFVPPLVRRYRSRDTLRPELGIPEKAKVFGRHGGWDTFNIPFVHQAVARHARKFPCDHFIFINTEPVSGTQNLKNVHYLAATIDPEAKGKFLSTCDAMLHARLHGETFGLAVGEFAVLGKPVITFGGSRERAHLDMLGKHGRVYRTDQELRDILETFEPCHVEGTEYETYADNVAVMNIFQTRFLNRAG
jgi:hypothetical protein